MLAVQSFEGTLLIRGSVQQGPSPSHSSTAEQRDVPKKQVWCRTGNKSRRPHYGKATSSTVGATCPLRNAFIAQAAKAESRGASEKGASLRLLHPLPWGKANLFDILAFQVGCGAIGTKTTWERRQACSGEAQTASQIHFVCKALLPCLNFGWAGPAAEVLSEPKSLTRTAEVGMGRPQGSALWDLGILCRGITTTERNRL